MERNLPPAISTITFWRGASDTSSISVPQRTYVTVSPFPDWASPGEPAIATLLNAARNAESINRQHSLANKMNFIWILLKEWFFAWKARVYQMRCEIDGAGTPRQSPFEIEEWQERRRCFSSLPGVESLARCL